MMINMLRAQVVDKVSPILKRHHIRRAFVFGSFARGTATPASDVDLLVELSRPMGLSFFGLQNELEEAIGRKVDLVTPQALSPYIKDRVLASAQKIYEQSH